MRRLSIILLLVGLGLPCLVSRPPATAQAPQIEVEDLPTAEPTAATQTPRNQTPQKLPHGYDKSAVAEESAELKVWNRRIVELRAVLADMTPAERVAQAEERIVNLPYSALTEKVWSEPTVIRDLDLVLIGVKDQVLLPLRLEDIDPASSQTLEELGAEVAGRIQEVLRARAEQSHWPTVVRASLLSLLATAGFILVVWLIVRLRARLARFVGRFLSRRDMTVSGFNLKPYLRNVVRGTVSIVSWLMILPIAYLWLTFVLKRFPFTRPWGDQLGGFLLDLITRLLLGALSAVPGLFTAFLIFLFTRFLTRVVSAFFHNVENQRLDVGWLQPETAKATRRLVIVLMWIFALTVAYPYIPGSDSEAFKGISVFVGLMVSLGATGLVNQIVSGMVIVYTQAFRPGEFVRIGEVEGVVDEIGVLSTKISTRKREHITIPNAVLVSSTVDNFSRIAADTGAVLTTSVTIGYDVPWRQVHALLELAASRCAGVRKEPAPYVLQATLSDFYVEYTLFVYFDGPAERVVVASDLHGKIQDAFNEFGVQIMSPHYRDTAEEPVVVPRDGWVLPPAEPEEE